MPWLQMLCSIQSFSYSPDSSYAASYLEHMKPFSVPEHLLFPSPLSRMLFLQILHPTGLFSTLSSQLKCHPPRGTVPQLPTMSVPSVPLPDSLPPTKLLERITAVFNADMRRCCCYLHFTDEWAETKSPSQGHTVREEAGTWVQVGWCHIP